MLPTTRNLVATTGVLALVVGLAPRAIAVVFTADCTNPTTNLQMVINATSDGDTINVSGTCVGNSEGGGIYKGPGGRLQ